MKRIFLSLTCLCATFAFCETQQPHSTTNAPKRKHTPAELQKALQVARMKKTGGFVRKAGSAKGCFVVLNGQKKVPEVELKVALATLDRQTKVQTKMVESSGLGVDNVRDKIRSAGGSVGVAVVESETLPSLLAAPETGWAIVNVSALCDGSDAGTLASRLRKEILRSFAFVAGGCYSPFGDFLMRDITAPKNLDVVSNEEFNIAMLQRFSQSLGSYKITPWYETTYLKACEEGWAPAPTNDYQKAIWGQVHAMPTNPIKIKPEAKKVRE